MTIQRQYVLPNCSLLLEGLSTDTSNVLSVLANAEFKVVGREQPLAGARTFLRLLLRRLVPTVSDCSVFRPSGHLASQSALVAIEPDEGQYHRLLVQPELLGTNGGERQPRELRYRRCSCLIWQKPSISFCRWSDAAGAFGASDAPGRRYVRSQEPLTQRALPPILGVATLAVAGLGLFFLPVPEVLEETLTPPAALEGLR